MRFYLLAASLLVSTTAMSEPTPGTQPFPKVENVIKQNRYAEFEESLAGKTVGDLTLLGKSDFRKEVIDRLIPVLGKDKAEKQIRDIESALPMSDLVRVMRAYHAARTPEARQEVLSREMRFDLKEAEKTGELSLREWTAARLNRFIPEEETRNKVARTLVAPWLIRDLTTIYEAYDKLEASKETYATLAKIREQQRLEDEAAKQEKERIAEANQKEQKSRADSTDALLAKQHRAMVGHIANGLKDPFKDSKAMTKDEALAALRGDATVSRGKKPEDALKSIPRHSVEVKKARAGDLLASLNVLFISGDDDLHHQRVQLGGGTALTVGSAAMYALGRRLPEFKGPKNKNARRLMTGITAFGGTVGLAFLHGGFQSELRMSEKKKRIEKLKDSGMYKLLVDSLGPEGAESFLADWEADRSPEDLLLKYSSKEDNAELKNFIQSDTDEFFKILGQQGHENYIEDPILRKEVAAKAGSYVASVRMLLKELSTKDKAFFEETLKKQKEQLLKKIKSDLDSFEPVTGQRTRGRLTPESAPMPRLHK